MGKNIVLVGLAFDENLGDPMIYHCTKSMIKEVMREQDCSCELRKLDLYGRKKKSNNFVELQYERVIKKLVNLTAQYDAYTDKNFKSRCEELIDKETCGIVFVGGGIIKYCYQVISPYVIYILELADKKNIPVMLSGVGVEGYDEKNLECMKLKQAINFDCVKKISTRDDYELLSKKYINNSNIQISQVYDPALFCKDYLEISSAKFFKNGIDEVIGLGIARGNIFRDYGIQISEEDVIQFWVEMYKVCKDNRKECVIFCNGLRADYIFAKRVAKKIDKNNWKSILVKRAENIVELAETIAGLDRCIVTRLHSSIIAESFGIPFMGIVWNEKQRMFGRSIGCEDRFVDISRVNPHKLYDELMLQSNNVKVYQQTTKQELQSFLTQWCLI